MQKVATQAVANAGSQAALVACAPGQIVHSNHLSAQTFLDMLATLPGLTIPPEMMQQLAQCCINVVGSQAIEVPAPTVPAQPQQQPQDTAQPPRQGSGVAGGEAVASQAVIQLDMETLADDAELTDLTDSDAELANANSALPPVAMKKKGTRAAKKEKKESKAAGTSAGVDKTITKEKPARKEAVKG